MKTYALYVVVIHVYYVRQWPQLYGPSIDNRWIRHGCFFCSNTLILFDWPLQDDVYV